jgi:RecA/RadA recombinase
MSLADRIREKIGKAKAIAGSEDSWVNSFLPSGSIVIDWVLGGGWAQGRLAEIYGPYGVGKSLLLQMALIQNQKLGGLSMLNNPEVDFLPERFISLGGKYDPENEEDPGLLVRPDPGDVNADELYLEHYFEGIQSALDAQLEDKCSTPLAIGIDSIAALKPIKTKKISVSDANMKYQLERAMAMSNCCPVIADRARRAGVPIIATNQCRESPDPYERETKTTGGRAWPYYCSTRLELDNGQFIRTEDKHETLGRWVHATNTKSRFGAFMRQASFPIYLQDCQHPIYDVSVKAGVCEEEALWAFYVGITEQKKPARFKMPDGSQAVNTSKPGWYALHADIGDTSNFRRADWVKVLADNPKLWTLPTEVVK